MIFFFFTFPLVPFQKQKKLFIINSSKFCFLANFIFFKIKYNQTEIICWFRLCLQEVKHFTLHGKNSPNHSTKQAQLYIVYYIKRNIIEIFHVNKKYKYLHQQMCICFIYYIYGNECGRSLVFNYILLTTMLILFQCVVTLAQIKQNKKIGLLL